MTWTRQKAETHGAIWAAGGAVSIVSVLQSGPIVEPDCYAPAHKVIQSPNPDVTNA